ncbi:hypothetical protein [Piscibacillus salipiscarius]|uniref:Cytochrome c oxidase subunit 4 n=1 Tax=Piscibacillus salipiscarius TaxID=299480 RepID=A0ABW5Q6P0_9BACI|nr:hypothetical protein [Piscibacillus salipiscarius]
MGYFNIASLILGVVAWFIPIIALVYYKQRENSSWALLTFLSISACAIALLFQIVYQNHLVRIEDWAALMDTSGTLVRVGTVLVLVTLVSNGVMIYRHKAS